MATLLTNIRIPPTLNTCRVLHNTSSIDLIDSGGHFLTRLAEPTMAESGGRFVLLQKMKDGAVFAEVKTAPEISPAPIVTRDWMYP
jgi:hypothetical protein